MGALENAFCLIMGSLLFSLQSPAPPGRGQEVFHSLLATQMISGCSQFTFLLVQALLHCSEHLTPVRREKRVLSAQALWEQ